MQMIIMSQKYYNFVARIYNMAENSSYKAMEELVKQAESGAVLFLIKSYSSIRNNERSSFYNSTNG